MVGIVEAHLPILTVLPQIVSQINEPKCVRVAQQAKHTKSGAVESTFYTIRFGIAAPGSTGWMTTHRTTATASRVQLLVMVLENGFDSSLGLLLLGVCSHTNRRIGNLLLAIRLLGCVCVSARCVGV